MAEFDDEIYGLSCRVVLVMFSGVYGFDKDIVSSWYRLSSPLTKKYAALYPLCTSASCRAAKTRVHLFCIS